MKKIHEIILKSGLRLIGAVTKKQYENYSGYSIKDPYELRCSYNVQTDEFAYPCFNYLPASKDPVLFIAQSEILDIKEVNDTWNNMYHRLTDMETIETEQDDLLIERLNTAF